MEVEAVSVLQKKHLADIPADLDAECAKLIALALEVGVDISSQQAEKLISYLALVLKKNEVMNLTAIREWDKALVLHLVDSLVALPEIDRVIDVHGNTRYLDMGCGAGFPGIPLAIMREDFDGLLCDSVKKKIAAVDEFVAELGLEGRVSTTSKRLEELGREERRAFGCITARALASLPVLIEYATPMLVNRGSFVAVKGRPTDKELADGTKAAEICGLKERSRRLLELPDGMGERMVIVYEKVSEAKVGLPRMVGEATKKPIHQIVSRETVKKRK